DVCEARHVAGSCTSICAPSDQEVVIEYNNTGNGCSTPPELSAGCSVTGGFRYRGPDPAVQGIYFYGDACTARLYYSAETSPNNWVAPSTATQVAIAGTILGFGEDEFGIVYFVAGSSLYRIGSSDILFTNGFE
ncbi:MAG TPA: hypothetical protein VND91_06575, partial [Candidatus Saccharimonadia bacterium]|nr:hypothetical protein [Candidatus Saccharimonadia bacterium]